MLNLDTHILVHALNGDLSAREKRLLTNDQWSISAIVLWELCKLVELRRIDLDLGDAEVQSALSRCSVWPLSLDICRKSTELDVAGDPADQLIAATSVVHRIPLLTRDGKISRSKIVPLA